MSTLRRFALLLALALAAAPGYGCADHGGFEEVEDQADNPELGKADALSGPITVTEIGDNFVELRNDGNEVVDLDGYFLSFSRRRVMLSAHDGRSSSVVPGGLVVVVDSDTEIPERVPTWSPIVDTSVDIEELLEHSKSLIVRDADRTVTDRIDARSAAITGIAVERKSATTVRLSARGQTPGYRNVLRDDHALQIFSSSPMLEEQSELPEHMVEFLDEADETLDGALYQLGNEDVIDAFIAAHDRGVTVRIVTDTRYFEDPDYVAGYQRMIDAGIEVLDDQRTARQHNKFVVRDGRAVWTGSYNPIPEERGHFIEFEDAMILESEPIATMHTIEFEEMFGGKFGKSKEDNTEHEAAIDGSRIQVYFSPTDGVQDAILHELGRAQRSIYFTQFAFFLSDVGNAMLDADQRGVEVRGVLDRRSASAISQWKPLTDGGLDIRRPFFDAFLHHKFIVIDYGTDDARVLTGSYNLSASAENQNDETLFVIHDPYVVQLYYEMYTRLYLVCSGPNTAPEPLAPVTISEVYVGTPERDGRFGGPFVELANASSDSQSLTDMFLEDRDGNAVAVSGTLADGERIAFDTTDLGLAFDDALVLRDKSGRAVSRFDAPGFHGPGISVQRQGLADEDMDAAWVPSLEVGGTPGR